MVKPEVIQNSYETCFSAITLLLPPVIPQFHFVMECPLPYRRSPACLTAYPSYLDNSFTPLPQTDKLYTSYMLMFTYCATMITCTKNILKFLNL